MDGTSMASPHIAGLGAYLMGLKGKQAPAALCNLIKSTATTGAIKGIPGVDTQNRIAFNGAS
jgi:subtilisin family serine protease